MASALAPSWKPWELRDFEIATQLPRTALSRTLATLEKRGFIRAFRPVGDADAHGWNVLTYQLTDIGRGHFGLPIPADPAA